MQPPINKCQNKHNERYAPSTSAVKPPSIIIKGLLEREAGPVIVVNAIGDIHSKWGFVEIVIILIV